MKRSILLSVLVMGTAISILAAAGTQALFSDSQTASGDVNAGTLNLYLLQNDDDDNGENEFVFESPAIENLTPGNSVTDNLRLRNDGTSALTIASIDFSGSIGADCDLTIGGEEFQPSINVVPGDILPPGTFFDATIEVELAAGAGNDCQGAVYNMVLLITVN